MRTLSRSFLATFFLIVALGVQAASPTVAINQAAGQADPTNASPITFTVVFNQAVTGFTAGDVSFAGSTVGGTLSAFVTPSSGTTYTVTVTGMNGTGTVVASIPAGAATNGTETSLASTSTDNTVTFDTVRPTVTINQAAAQADPVNALPMQFTVAFSEPVTGFSASDVSFAGSTAAGSYSASVTGSGANYTVSVSGSASNGTIVVGIPVNAAVDLAGNLSFASTSTDNTVTVDTVRPTVTINQAAAQADPASASPVQFTVAFSEPVTGFSGADVSFAGSTVGGSLVAGVSGSGASYTVSVTGMSGSGTVVASIPANTVTDLAGNLNFASTSTDNTVSFGNVRPTVTINQAASQSDPTAATPIFFDVVFSAPVTGFTGADISFAGSTVGGPLVANVTGSGTTYSVSVSGMSSSSGQVVASIPANAASDTFGNPSFASTSSDNTVTFDTERPTVTINQAPGQADPAGGSPIQFAVTFSEPVIGFSGSDVSFAGSTAAGTLTANLNGSGANYTVVVTGMASSGTVVASLPVNAVTDLAGNLSFASTSTDNTVSFVSSNGALSPDPTSLDFGGQSMNTTAPAQSVTVTNNSSTPISPSSVTTTPGFGVTHNCTTIAPGASCVVMVTFTPGTEGPIAGTLFIANGAAPTQVTVSLAGVGERSLVTHYYRSILRRAPDAGGKAFWLNEAARSQSLGLDPNETWYAMAQQFYASAEYLAFGRDDASFVTDLYNTFFNRAPDPSGMSFWTSQLSQGMPREVVLTSFTFSAEFVAFTQALFGTPSVRPEIDMVTDFYRGLLSRLPDDGGFTYWLGRFRNAQCAGAGAVNSEVEAISSGFVNSGEYGSRGRSTGQYVGDLYNAFLRRGGDLGGVQYWINQIDTGARSYDDVRQNFIASSEFQQRVNQVVAAGCF